MRCRLALVTATLLVAGGCGRGVESATGPNVAPTATVAPLPFTFATDGPILDLFCPDALGWPQSDVQPDTDRPQP